MHKNIKLLFLLLLGLQVVHVMPMARVCNFGRPFRRIAQNCMRHKKLCGLFVAVAGASTYVAHKVFHVCHQQAQRPRVGADQQTWLQRLVAPIVRWFRPAQPVVLPVADIPQEERPVADDQPREQPAEVPHDPRVAQRVVANQDHPLIRCGDLPLQLIAAHLPLADVAHVRRAGRALQNFGHLAGRNVTLNYARSFRPGEKWGSFIVDPFRKRNALQRMEREYTQCVNGGVAVTLDLSHNFSDGMRIPRHIFEKFQNLKGLNLSHNTFNDPRFSFRYDCSRWEVKNICRYLLLLQELDLSHMGIHVGIHVRKLPPEIENLQHLRKLNLQGNRFRLDALTDICRSLPQLEELNISNNGIVEHLDRADQLLEWFREIGQIERQQRLTIDLRGNGIPAPIQAAVRAELERQPLLDVVF